MNFWLQFLLISHIFFGLLGIIFFYAVLMALLKLVDGQRLKFLKFCSLAGFINFVLSWLAGDYYAFYYGKSVKPVIMASDYPWAHTIIMETKEHIFLFLPFAALAIILMFYLFGDILEQNQKIKKSIIALSAIIVIIGITIALMGIIISGAVR